MKIKCIKPGNNKLISANTEYDLIEETNERYVILNDKGIQKNYAKNLFQKVEAEVAVERVVRAPRPEPIIPPVVVIEELNIQTVITGSADEGWGFTITVPLTPQRTFSYAPRNFIFERDCGISCGILELEGMDGIMARLTTFKQNFMAYLRQHAAELKLHDDINFDEVYNDVIDTIIQDLVAHFQGDDYNKGIILLSTNVTNNGSLNTSFITAIEKVAATTVEVHNPNSGNRIKLWTLVINED